MSKSTSSTSSRHREPQTSEDDRASQAQQNALANSGRLQDEPASAFHARRAAFIHHLTLSPRNSFIDESSSLLQHDSQSRGYRSAAISQPHTPTQQHSRQLTYSQSLRTRAAGRRDSKRTSSINLSSSLDQDDTVATFDDNRAWYDQFTSTDWIRDAIADAARVKQLRSRNDWRGKIQAYLDGAQGWVLVAIIGCLTAMVAYGIDVTEATLFDFKTGYCSTVWWYNKRMCCGGATVCKAWRRWSSIPSSDDHIYQMLDFAAFVLWVIVLSLLACSVTMITKTTIASNVALSNLDEDLGGDSKHKKSTGSTASYEDSTAKTYYPAAGSGVAEVKVILSGFVLHGYLGVRTLVCKSVGLILSVGSGLSIGKEGPYVHIATCIGNIASRMFAKYRKNDAKRREVLSASAAAGVAVAFGSPIGGILFSLEEVSYYFPPKTLFRTFFCSIIAALFLKFLNPYGTNKIVLFEVRYLTGWHIFEIGIFVLLGIIGGTIGALMIKASRLWALTFRRLRLIKRSPLTEVLLVAVVTGLISFWNRYTRLPVAELLYELATPCNSFSGTGTGLCPTQERIPQVITHLFWAFAVKLLLTIISFGVKVPAGIYVPSMVIGGLFGRIVGHTVQYTILAHPGLGSSIGCPSDGDPESCIVPGVYALITAGATMCGVTRLSVTLAVILFELTGSLEHVLPFSLGILVAKWTADAIEPASIYDLLIESYPYLDSKTRPIFTTQLADLVVRPHRIDYIDISSSTWVATSELRRKLFHLQTSGDINSGFPIVQDQILKGFIPAPDLEFALDRLENEDHLSCYMDPHHVLSLQQSQVGTTSFNAFTQRENSNSTYDLRDLTEFIDPAPMALDICSPMDLVFECFTKLGLSYVCVLQEGQYAGMLHKKTFARYVKVVKSQG